MGNHYLSKVTEKVTETIVEMDISFITQYFGRIGNQSLEIMLVKLYDTETNIITEFNNFVYSKIYGKLPEANINVVEVISKELYMSEYMQVILEILNKLEGTITKHVGPEVLHAKFHSFKVVNREKVIVTFMIKQ